MLWFWTVEYTSLVTMVAVTYLLVLACAWSAAAVAIPGLGQACTSIQIGQLVGKPIHLDKTTLKEGQPNWNVLIPDIPDCPHGLLGVNVLVCDYDVAPEAYFESMNIIVVLRKGGLLFPGSVTTTVYCGLLPQKNNQPLLQNNQLYLSDSLPWQSNQNVAHLYGQSPLSLSSPLPSLGLASGSSLGQLPNNLWGQSSLASLSVVPLSQGQSSLGLSPQSHLDLSHNALLGHSQQSSLPSLNAVPLSLGQSALPSLGHHHLHPLSLLDQPHNPLLDQPLQLLNLGQSPQLLSSQSSLPLLHLGQLPQLHSSQSSLPVSAQSPLLLGQCSQHLLGQSPLLLGQPSLPLLGNSPASL